MEIDLLCELHPQIYHMAHEEALSSVLKYGLLSTSALLDLFEISGARRIKLESEMRPSMEKLTNSNVGTAFLRDQKRIGNDVRLGRCVNGASVSEWHKLLNSKVFFWTTKERVIILRNARAYRNHKHLLLTLETAKVIREYERAITLCHMNSGSCMPMAHERSPDIFRPIALFDYDHWRQKGRGRTKAVVEFAVEGAVKNISKFLVAHEIL